jgi:hypothetical protein
MFPHRFEYPEDNVFWWQLRLERHLYDKKTVFLVVEIDHEEEETAVENTIGPASKIIAYGIWERTGRNKATQKRFAAKNTLLNMLDSELGFVIYKLEYSRILHITSFHMTSHSNTSFANIKFIKNNCEGGKMVSRPKVPETRRGFIARLEAVAAASQSVWEKVLFGYYGLVVTGAARHRSKFSVQRCSD